MRCEAPPDTGLRGGVAQLGARGAGRPCAAAGRAGRDAQHRTDRKVDARGEPWLKLVPGPVVHADLAAATALGAAHEKRAAPRIEVRLAEGEGLVDPQTRAPQHDDQRAQPRRMKPAAGVSHDSDDLRHGGRVGRVPLALVARRAASVEARHGGRRARAAGRIKKELGQDASLRLGPARLAHTGRESPTPRPLSAGVVAEGLNKRYRACGRRAAATSTRPPDRSSGGSATTARARPKAFIRHWSRCPSAWAWFSRSDTRLCACEDAHSARTTASTSDRAARLRGRDEGGGAWSPRPAGGNVSRQGCFGRGNSRRVRSSIRGLAALELLEQAERDGWLTVGEAFRLERDARGLPAVAAVLPGHSLRGKQAQLSTFKRRDGARPRGRQS